MPTLERGRSASELSGIDAYWRAANYLTVGQIYLRANALLRQPLQFEHIKPRLLGHWARHPGCTSPTFTSTASFAATT